MPWKPPHMTRKQLINRDVISFIEYLRNEYEINRVPPSIEISNGKIKVCGGYIGIGVTSDGSIDCEFEEWE